MAVVNKNAGNSTWVAVIYKLIKQNKKQSFSSANFLFKLIDFSYLQVFSIMGSSSSISSTKSKISISSEIS